MSATVLSVVSLLAAFLASANGAETIRYGGTVARDESTRLLLTVTGREVVFDTGKIPMACDDGTTERIRPGKVTAKLSRNNEFQTDRSFADPHSGTQAFYFVEGELKSPIPS